MDVGEKATGCTLSKVKGVILPLTSIKHSPFFSRWRIILSRHVRFLLVEVTACLLNYTFCHFCTTCSACWKGWILVMKKCSNFTLGTTLLLMFLQLQRTGIIHVRLDDRECSTLKLSDVFCSVQMRSKSFQQDWSHCGTQCHHWTPRRLCDVWGMNLFSWMS